jgi:predicted permease
VISFREGYLGTTGGLLWILMGAGLVLLLIAAANVANLLLVRSHGRTRELVLRRALGAQPGRIAGQVLAESTLLAGLGGLVGVGIALVSLDVLGPMIPSGVLPGYVEPELSATAFAVSLVALALVGVTTGLVPALSSARLDIATKLREGARAAAGGPGRVRSQHVFVVAQVALALVLMVGAGLLTRSFRAQLAVDTGSELEGVVTMRTQLPGSRFDSDEAIWTFARELEREVGAIPGTAGVTLASDLPFRNGTSASYIFREGEGAEDRIRYHRHSVTAGYFETLGIDVVEGRGFTADDVDGAPGVILITAAMARRVYPGESAVGKTMSLAPDGQMPVEIVGVVEDVRFRDVTTSLMADANSPDVFFSFWQIPSRGLEIAVRGDRAQDAPVLLATVRAELAELDPDLPAYQLAALRDAWLSQTATPRFAAFLMTLFSVLAAALACVGVYGVLAFTVGQRSQEIAIRRAIGASGARVARSVVASGLRLSIAGLAIGALVASGGARLLEGFLFGVETNDPLTYVSMGAGMVVVAAVAAVIPALRAMRRDPADALTAD